MSTYRLSPAQHRFLTACAGAAPNVPPGGRAAGTWWHTFRSLAHRGLVAMRIGAEEVRLTPAGARLLFFSRPKRTPKQSSR